MIWECLWQTFPKAYQLVVKSQVPTKSGAINKRRPSLSAWTSASIPLTIPMMNLPLRHQGFTIKVLPPQQEIGFGVFVLSLERIGSYPAPGLYLPFAHSSAVVKTAIIKSKTRPRWRLAEIASKLSRKWSWDQVKFESKWKWDRTKISTENQGWT